MAVLTKKLKIQKTGSSTVSCNIYSTTTEAGDTYMNCSVNDVNGYISLGNTSDANATVGRVMKGSTTYAIKSQSKPPYTEKSYTTAGTHTFTVPAGITRLRVAVCGGGGGGASEAGSWGPTAGAGGTSSFGSLLQATGAGKSSARGEAGGSDGDDWCRNAGSVGAAGSPNGNKGTKYIAPFGRIEGGATSISKGKIGSGGAGFALSFTKSSGTYGKGGDVKCYDSGGYACTSGSSGGYTTNYVNVTSNTAYTVTVGAGGSYAGGNASYAWNGNSGFVLIGYGGDI